MEKHAIQLAIKLGKFGSALGVSAGIIELSIGAKILPWIGNKESPKVLGIVTILLSAIAFFSVNLSNKHIKLTNDKKLAVFLGIFIPATICFTTVGRLWYLPGTLLTVTSFIFGYEYWFGQSKNISTKIIARKYGISPIIGGIGSLSILMSVVLACSNEIFGLVYSKFIVKTDYFRFDILPMDIVRITKIANDMITVENIEVSLVRNVYIFLIMGAGIAFIASLVKSYIFTVIGGVIVFTGLIIFLFWVPEIFEQTKLPSVRYENIIELLGSGWYISIAGMCLIIINSFILLKERKAIND